MKANSVFAAKCSPTHRIVGVLANGLTAVSGRFCSMSSSTATGSIGFAQRTFTHALLRRLVNKAV